MRGKLADLQKYIEKNAVKLPDGTPIFSARYFINMIEEAKQAVGSLKWMDELKGYVEKHAPKLDENTPIFSTRYFLKKIDEQKEWFVENFGATSVETRGNSDKT